MAIPPQAKSNLFYLHVILGILVLLTVLLQLFLLKQLKVLLAGPQKTFKYQQREH